jgi:hypothetical protein
LSRVEAQRRLGIPRRTLRDWEKEGRIRFVVDAEGWHWFAADDIQDLVERSTPAAARAFALFREGKSTVDAIIELGVEPSVVRGWREAYEAYEAADSKQLVVRVPHDLHHWAKVFHCSEADLRSPVKLLCALELCLSAPDLRARLDEAVEQALNPPTLATVSRETGSAAA